MRLIDGDFELILQFFKIKFEDYFLRLIISAIKNKSHELIATGILLVFLTIDFWLINDKKI